MMEKKTSGRRKLEMKAIADESKRHVAFSKRKSGIFNKAAELNVLTGAEVVVIVFSKYGKAYTFTTPGSDTLLSTWLGRTSGAAASVALGSQSHVAAAEAECASAKKELWRLEDSKRRLTAQRRIGGGGGGSDGGERGGCWWDRDVIGCEVEELEAFQEALVELRRKVAERVSALMAVRGRMATEMAGPSSYLGLLNGSDDGGVGGLLNGTVTCSPLSEVYN